ncbi:MAG: 4a-hydroxytetrahydrobiopterin dehydratase [bacterium]|nr:4a-hydroxytetrahydrobiopterin dehydratase [bacterium]MDZ4248417.1 4a-hydroxytetrahydrobiopterin dehydratase [Patescibacteria group bacterium]
MSDTLNNQEIQKALARLTDWKRAGESIVKEFERKDFDGAMKFVNKVAALATQQNHHPDIDIRWNKVRLALSTHASGGLTALDFQVAAQIDDIAT